MGDEKHRKQRNWGARILEYEHKGMQVVFLENEKLRVGVLVDKGTDVIEFNHKPTDTDFVWLAPGGVRNPTSYLSTAPDPLATFLDYYPGGWQEIFPNGGAPSSYLGASFGQHGEVSNLPWDYHIVEDGEQSVAVRFSVRTQKTPFLLQKTLRLRSGDSGIRFEETLTNESAVQMRAMWGHHIVFGRPFLEEGCRVRVPEGATVVPHEGPIDPDGRRVRGGDNYSWPVVAGESGAEVDLSVLPAWGTPSEIVYIKDLSKGFLAGPKASFVTGAEYMVDGGLLAALGVRLPEDDIIDGGMFEYEGGSIKVPDGPGLGVSLDRDKLDEYAELYKELGGYPYDRDPGYPGRYPLVPKQRFADPNKPMTPQIPTGQR